MCEWGECNICEKKVKLDTHQCYIQRIPEAEDHPKTKRVPRNEVGTRPFTEPDPGDPDTRVIVDREPPLQVYCDYEAITDAEGNQTPILLCLEDDKSDITAFFYGPDCTADMFQHLESLAVDVAVMTETSSSSFTISKATMVCSFYATHREVKDQITVGTKLLSMKSDRLTFKDSLCFLPFPLANFPATFGITEHCKGFFPHKFNTLENQDYEGPLPHETRTILTVCPPKRKRNLNGGTKRKYKPTTNL